MSALLAMLASAVAVAVLAFTVLDIFFSEDRRIRRRLATLDAYTAGGVAEAQPLAAPFKQRVLRPALGALSRGLATVAPGDYMKRLRSRVLEAGRPGRVDAERILVFKLIAAAVGFGLVAFLGGFLGLGGARTLLMAIIATLALSYVPDVYLSTKAEERRKQIVRELPDMLDMLTISVEAGLGFDQAVSKYVQNATGPLAKEYGIALMEIQAGKPRREALRAMAERTKVPELRAFIMAIVQADVFGVSVAEVLRTQSHEMRVRRRQLAEEMAQKAPAKMTFPLILCILPATLIVVVGPAVVGIMALFGGM